MPSTKSWKDIYQGDFKKHLNFVETLKPKLDVKIIKKLPIEKHKILCVRYKELFTKSLDLLKSYLNYNGLFANDNTMIIKYSYYSEIIEDGQRWINLLFLFNELQKQGFEKGCKPVLMHFNKDYIRIFEQLDEYFKKAILEDSK